MILFHVVSLIESQDWLRRLLALCFHSRPALPHQPLGNPVGPVIVHSLVEKND